MLFLLVFVDSLKNISGFLMFVIIGKIDNNVVSLRKCRHTSGFQNLVGTSLLGKVINVGSEILATQFFKSKLAIILNWMFCLALQPGQKSGMILPLEMVLKLKLQKINFIA